MSEFLPFFVSAVAGICVHLGKGLKLVIIYVQGYVCSCGWVVVDYACELVFVRVCGLKGVFWTAFFVRFWELGNPLPRLVRRRLHSFSRGVLLSIVFLSFWLLGLFEQRLQIYV